MASAYFENYSRNLQRILMAEFVDNLRYEGRCDHAVAVPGFRHHTGHALRLAFAEMKPIPMPERAL